MRPLLTVLLGIALAFAIACGGDGDDASSGADGDADNSGGNAATQAPGGSAGAGAGGGATLQDACSLLSDEQVNAALGDDAVASRQGEPPTQALSTCQWQGSNAGNRYVLLTIRTAQFATSVFESNYKSAPGAVSVPGIGDEAYALTGADTPNNYRFLTMAALTSSLYVQLNVAGPNRSSDDALQTLTTTMEAVLGNLQ